MYNDSGNNNECVTISAFNQTSTSGSLKIAKSSENVVTENVGTTTGYVEHTQSSLPTDILAGKI